MRLHNSLEERTTAFTDTRQTRGVYVCGITPYAATHLGHLFTYAACDILIRYLRHRGFSVRYVQNLTDVDDAILRESKQRDESWRELGRRCALKYVDEMKALSIAPPDVFPRASDVIDTNFAPSPLAAQALRVRHSMRRNEEDLTCHFATPKRSGTARFRTVMEP